LRLDDNKRDWQPSFELDNVTFAYPARPAHKALNRVSVHIEPAKFTAFVGPSGSGKSTLAALLMRMYDPLTATKISETDQKIMKVLEEGVKKEKKKGIQKVADEEKDKDFDQAIDGNGIVRFAGQDVTSLNLSWLRHQVAVVQQNPQLVSGTVFDNVAIGLTGTEFEYHADIEGASDASPENKARLAKITTLITDALRKAQAWDFVEGLPQGLQTEVAGGRTGVLSGGQVQRVALARALVREPRCLLLDEATSAVSADTELKIQESLLEEQKRRGMTLIVIAHRLSTIVSADKIVVMTNGSIAHSGTYEELLDPNCPDQTFRNMALAIPQTTPVSRATSVVTLDHSSEDRVLTMDEKAMAAAVDTGDIPPPMTDVKQAFKKVGWLLTIGIALGLAVGAAFVMAAWLHGRGVAALDISDLSEMRRQVNRWALWFLVLAIVAVILDTMHVFGLEASGESLVSQFRFEAVRHLVRQDIAYFEQKDTGFGNLTAQATSHPTAVGNVIGVVLAQVVSSTSNLVATLIMAFVLNWRMAVIVIPSLFVTVLLGYINFRLLTIFEDNLSAERDKQANFVAESANSIQLNAALTREAEVVREFKLKYTSRPMKRGVLFNSALALGGSQAMVQLFAALIFYWGALNLAQGRVVGSASVALGKSS
jgi:ATP-binding cassette subfamily B (MDR/TAP) protein 1